MSEGHFESQQVEEIGHVSGSKSEVVKKFQRAEGDTGSPEVQVAVLTHKLEQLNKHFLTNKLDKHSKRGLLRVVSKRKRLLGYLKNENIERYRALISELGLRK